MAKDLKLPKHVHMRQGSKMAWYARRVPNELVEHLKGRTLEVPLAGVGIVTVRLNATTPIVRLSLRAKAPSAIALRARAVTAFLDRYFSSLHASVDIDLTHRQLTALAGELYAAWATEPDVLPPNGFWCASLGLPQATPDDFEGEGDRLRGLAAKLSEIGRHEDAGERIAAYVPLVASVLAGKGLLAVTQRSRERLAISFSAALPEALRTRARIADGDYSPDPTLLRFPAWEAPEQIAACTMTGLVDLWWDEAKAFGKTPTTYNKYTLTFRLLSEFLGHNEALKVTPADIVRFKDFRLTAINPRLGKPLSAASFKAGDMIALKSVFKWATENGHIPMDPAATLKVRAPKRIKLRERDFTEAEAKALLKATATAPFRSDPKPVKRWVPWLCAYSGCRVGEAMQLRKQDFRKEHGTWVMTITPEAGTVKGKELREVPVHEHVLERGFAEFLEGAAEGYLFMFNPKDNPFPLLIKTELEKLRRFARRIVKDPNVAPNHAWRHSFKSRGFEVGIQEKVLDAICGHTPASVGRAYGSVSLKTKIDALRIFPRYETD